MIISMGVQRNKKKNFQLPYFFTTHGKFLIFYVYMKKELSESRHYKELINIFEFKLVDNLPYSSAPGIGNPLFNWVSSKVDFRAPSKMSDSLHCYPRRKAVKEDACFAAPTSVCGDDNRDALPTKLKTFSVIVSVFSVSCLLLFDPGWSLLRYWNCWADSPRWHLERRLCQDSMSATKCLPVVYDLDSLTQHPVLGSIGLCDSSRQCNRVESMLVLSSPKIDSSHWESCLMNPLLGRVVVWHSSSCLLTFQSEGVATSWKQQVWKIELKNETLDLEFDFSDVISKSNHDLKEKRNLIYIFEITENFIIPPSRFNCPPPSQVSYFASWVFCCCPHIQWTH